MQISVQDRPVYAYTGGREPRGDAPAVVFIHGASHDHSVWILQSRYLAHHGYPVYAFDLPGHGRSAGPALQSVEALGAWLPAALDAAGVGRAHLVGHSMGSLIALEASAALGVRLASITLIGTAFPMKVSDALLAAARDDEQRAFEMINLWSHSSLAHQPGTPGPGFSVFMQNLRLMQRQPRGTLAVDFNACNAYAGGLERAKALRCPALFIVGAADAMTPPRATQALIDATARAEVVRIERCGHALMAERPDAVLAALTKFLAAVKS